MAITNYPSGNFLYALDNANNVIDMYDGTFTLVKSFGDPSIPSNFSPFGIQDINGMVYVAYAKPNYGSGGYVDVFTENGVKVKTLIKGLPLNQAWGIALAPSNFGPLSNTLLISNNSEFGTINAFDPSTASL
ncbi:MAG: TIGR03118 family protein [Terriglobales bacterium]